MDVTTSNIGRVRFDLFVFGMEFPVLEKSECFECKIISGIRFISEIVYAKNKHLLRTNGSVQVRLL